MPTAAFCLRRNPTGYHSQMLWQLLLFILERRAGEPGGVLCSWGIPPDSELPHSGCGTCPFHFSTSPISHCVAFLYILSYRTLGGSPWWFFCNSVLMWPWKNVSTMFTYSVILTRNVREFCFMVRPCMSVQENHKDKNTPWLCFLSVNTANLDGWDMSYVTCLFCT